MYFGDVKNNGLFCIIFYGAMLIHEHNAEDISSHSYVTIIFDYSDTNTAAVSTSLLVTASCFSQFVSFMIAMVWRATSCLGLLDLEIHLSISLRIFFPFFEVHFCHGIAITNNLWLFTLTLYFYFPVMLITLLVGHFSVVYFNKKNLQMYGSSIKH